MRAPEPDPGNSVARKELETAGQGDGPTDWLSKTLGMVLEHAAHRLREAGVEDPQREARRILQVATDLPAVTIITETGRSLNAGQGRAFAALLARRAGREPLSRIIGGRDFYGRHFLLGPQTLDPRPDTETLIEAALQVVDEAGWRHRPLRILDVGTGTGCLLVTLLAELPLASGLGTDVSASALEVARTNAMRHDVLDRATFAIRDACSAIEGSFDLLVSNPPYIASAEIARLEPEVRDHDPHAALDGGCDGLAIYRAIAPDLRRLVPSGWCLFEVGAGQHVAVAELISAHPTGSAQPPVRKWSDLGGRTRVVAFRTQ